VHTPCRIQRKVPQAPSLWLRQEWARQLVPQRHKAEPCLLSLLQVTRRALPDAAGPLAPSAAAPGEGTPHPCAPSSALCSSGIGLGFSCCLLCCGNNGCQGDCAPLPVRVPPGMCLLGLLMSGRVRGGALKRELEPEAVPAPAPAPAPARPAVTAPVTAPQAVPAPAPAAVPAPAPAPVPADWDSGSAAAGGGGRVQ